MSRFYDDPEGCSPARYITLSADQCAAPSLGRVPRGMPRHLPGPSVAGSGSSTQSRPASLLQWRMVALLNMLDKLPGNEESCWCTTQC